MYASARLGNTGSRTDWRLPFHSEPRATDCLLAETCRKQLCSRATGCGRRFSETPVNPSMGGSDATVQGSHTVLQSYTPHPRFQCCASCRQNTYKVSHFKSALPSELGYTIIKPDRNNASFTLGCFSIGLKKLINLPRTGNLKCVS